MDARALAMLIPILALAIPIVAIITTHMQTVARLKAQSQQGLDSRVAEEIQSLKQQIADLRDTSTRYDMSFDAALQRIESRVGNVEARVSTLEQSSAPANAGRQA